MPRLVVKNTFLDLMPDDEAQGHRRTSNAPARLWHRQSSVAPRPSKSTRPRLAKRKQQAKQGDQGPSAKLERWAALARGLCNSVVNRTILVAKDLLLMFRGRDQEPRQRVVLSGHLFKEFAAVCFARPEEVAFMTSNGLLRIGGDSNEPAVEVWCSDGLLRCESMAQLLQTARLIDDLWRSCSFQVLVADVAPIVLRWSPTFSQLHLRIILHLQGYEPDSYLLTHLGRQLDMGDSETLLCAFGIFPGACLFLWKSGVDRI